MALDDPHNSRRTNYDRTKASLINYEELQSAPDEQERLSHFESQLNQFERKIGEPFIIAAGVLKLGVAWWAYHSTVVGGYLGLFSTEFAFAASAVFVIIGVQEVVGGLLAYRAISPTFAIVPAILGMAALVTFPFDYIGFTRVRSRTSDFLD